MATTATKARRPVLLAIGVGVGMAFVAIAIITSIIAIPFFALARFAEPGRGLDQPVIRNGLLHVAVPVGLAFGTVTGIAVALWYRRGGHLPREWE
jgi:hypothetical protein